MQINVRLTKTTSRFLSIEYISIFHKTSVIRSSAFGRAVELCHVILAMAFRIYCFISVTVWPIAIKLNLLLTTSQLCLKCLPFHPFPAPAIHLVPVNHPLAPEVMLIWRLPPWGLRLLVRKPPVDLVITLYLFIYFKIVKYSHRYAENSGPVAKVSSSDGGKLSRSERDHG